MRRKGVLRALGTLALVTALHAAATACNLRPVSRSLTRWGSMDTRGHIVIPLQFTRARDFSEGLAAVRVQAQDEQAERLWRYGYIDRSGTLAIPPRFDAALEFSGGRARVGVDGRRTFIDRTGARITEATFDDAKDFHEGLAQVKLAARWGYLDTTGVLAIPAEFTRTGRSSEGLATASRSGTLGGYIDRSGTIVSARTLKGGWPFTEGLALVGNGGPI